MVSVSEQQRMARFAGAGLSRLMRSAPHLNEMENRNELTVSFDRCHEHRTGAARC